MPDIQDIGVATPGTGTGPPILGGTGRWISAKPLRKCFIEVGYISEENTLMCKDVVDDLFYSSETFLFENFDLSPRPYSGSLTTPLIKDRSMFKRI